jgi:hypothetical protein
MAGEDTWVPIMAFGSMTVIAIGFPLARAYAKRIAAGSTPPTISPDTAARLERMEQAIDSIAVEVERISEGQRFATRLLAERESSAAPAIKSSTRREV